MGEAPDGARQRAEGPRVIARPELGALIAALRSRGWRVVGPTVREGRLVHDEITAAEQLPAGWRDVQAPGRYRLEHTEDPAVFGHNVGPESWKPLLHADRVRLFGASRGADGAWVVDASAADGTMPLALFGVRACDLAAIRILDRVLAEGEHPDPHYVARRRDLFVVAVDCGRAGATCFCASAGTGPGARDGYDIALTEVVGAQSHHFVARAATERGAEVLDAVPHRKATDAEIAAAEALVAQAAASMGRSLDFTAAREHLLASLDSRHWEEVAQRCLSCGNCTLVCPTCFCTTVEDSTSLDGTDAGRVRTWDSCFALSHSYIHGGSVRRGGAARYRQWITHKLATWEDQFGTRGCTGCGRCITWCPVGIDITLEARS